VRSSYHAKAAAQGADAHEAVAPMPVVLGAARP
jgi:hypothetical protein